MNKNKNIYYGVNFLDILLIVFIVLKLTNTIDWSWWWVLAPLWIPWILIIIIWIGMVCFIKRRSHK